MEENEKELKKKKKYEIDMCSGNLFWKIIKFSIPLMLMGMLQLFFTAADLIVVGNFSGDSEAIGAVGSTNSIINLTVNLFMGLSIGTNVVCAKLYGAKKYDEMSGVVHTSILASVVIGFLLGIFGVVFAKDLLHLMHNDLRLSQVYLEIFFIGMPFNLSYNFASAILRSVGDTKRPLYFLTIGGVANVFLNLLFVIVFKMSVAGVAWATVISQVISCVLIFIALMKTKEPYKLYISKLRINWKSFKEIIRIGLPAGIQSSLFGISNVLIQSSVNRFGPVIMNGNSAASSVEGFVYQGMNAVYNAALAFTSQNYGAKNVKNIKKITIYSLTIVTMVAIILGGSLFLLGRPALSIYTKVPEEIEIGYIRLHYLCLPYFLCGIMDVMVGCLRGLGSSTTPMIVSIIGVCLFRVFWIYCVFYPNTNFVDMKDLNLLYVSYPISWIITFIVHLICYLIISKRRFKEINADLELAK